jgi:signal transduction histidine kinase
MTERRGRPGFLLRLSRSLFLRLALVVVLTAVAINTANYALLMDLRSQGDTAINRNLVQYVHYLAEEIGQPADADKARVLAQRLRMRIRLDAPSGGGQPSWEVSAEGLAEDMPEKYLRTWYSSDTVQAASIHSFHRIRLRTADGGHLTFDLHPTPEERALNKLYAWASVGICLLLLFAAALAMRWLLRPVDWLTRAAGAVRDGDLTRRVPESRGGELRELSRTFNQMVASLERAISAQQRLVLDVSHELRTPMTRLRLQLEMLPEGSVSAQALEAMREDLREMEAMVHSILEAASLRHDAGALRLDQVDLAALARGVAERLRATGVSVELRLPEGPLRLRADADKLTTVLRNLLDNAMKYGRAADGSCRIELDLGLGLGLKAGQAVFTVRDHGPGIRPDALPHVFEPFFRADAARSRTADDGRGGFGLGLCLCQAIVQAHGGSIAVESEPGEGTAFVVTLPLR